MSEKRNLENEKDEELIELIREGESGVQDFLLDKYKNLVRKKAGSMYIIGGDRDDLIQEGMIGLFKAINGFDCGRDASFYTFAELCISRQIYSAVQNSNRQKHIPLNTYVSFNTKVGESDMPSATIGNTLASRNAAERDPEELVIDRENVKTIEEAVNTILSSFEKEVFELYVTGMNYTEIAAVLNKSEKSTDNALFRIKSKLRKSLGK